MSKSDNRQLRINANGVSQHVYLAGPERGKPVLLIHGLGWDAGRLWQRQLDTFAGTGWRVIAPDLRGVGGTEATADDYTISGYADDLSELLKALGIGAAAAVGFSLGAMIAAALAVRQAAAVKALVLACGNVYSSAAGEAATETMLAHARQIGAQAFAGEQAKMIWSPAWADANPASLAAFKSWRAQMNQDALQRAFRSANGVDLRPALSRLNIPVQVIAAADDAFISVREAQNILQHLPNAVTEFALIGAAGHMVSLERPAEFDATVMRFLNQHWPAQT